MKRKIGFKLWSDSLGERERGVFDGLFCFLGEGDFRTQ
jgi:hypothetical protein